MADGLPVENGSEAHLLMHKMSQEALRITVEIVTKDVAPRTVVGGVPAKFIKSIPDTHPTFNRDNQ